MERRTTGVRGPGVGVADVWKSTGVMTWVCDMRKKTEHLRRVECKWQMTMQCRRTYQIRPS